MLKDNMPKEGDVPINPGIRRMVDFLRQYDFLTIDSGDGETHACACDRNYGYVAIRVENEHELIDEAVRLKRLLWGCGIQCVPQGTPLEGDKPQPCIQASYDPCDDIALLELFYVHDSLLPPLKP